MFKKPCPVAFFEKPKKIQPQLKEEKLLIQIIREESRTRVIRKLSREQGHAPGDKEVEKVLDLVIEKLRHDGFLQEMLDEYLQGKIAAERAKSGIGI